MIMCVTAKFFYVKQLDSPLHLKMIHLAQLASQETGEALPKKTG